MMIAAKELARIVKTGQIDNSQVACLTDALVDGVGKDFAERFVNKQLEDSEIVGVKAFPQSLAREKLVEANHIWQDQDWNAKHRLASKDPVAAQSARKQKEDVVLRAKVAESAVRQQLVEAQKETAAVRRELDAANEALERKTQMIAESEAKCEEANIRADSLSGQVKELQEKNREVESELKSLSSAFPKEIVDVASKLETFLPEGADSRLVLFLYLALVSADKIDGRAFKKRFALFDEELFQLLRENPACLLLARQAFADDLNARMEDLCVSWSLLGERFDEAKFSPEDGFGDEVTEVKSALVTRKNTGAVIAKAKVFTDSAGGAVAYVSDR